MEIHLEQAGKKYIREWIFRGVSYTFRINEPVVILGANGSGKSTLLQVISTSLTNSEGKVRYMNQQTEIHPDKIYTHISYAAPYLDLVDEFTLRESIQFHGQFKKWRNGLDEKGLIELSGLTHAADKQLKYYSSGMRQRVKLLLAIMSDTAVVLLDEPCANLDEQAKQWYGQLITSNMKDRIVIVCSNNEQEEFFFCRHQLNIMDYKS
ncbi:MAG: heme ABC exporter ATP-binding protein CcmA [Bacteroidia bacterium]